MLGIGKNELGLPYSPVYIIELALKFSPFPLSVQRKELRDAEAIYQMVRNNMEKERSRLLELTCEAVEDKKVAVMADQVMAVQIFEKTSASGGNKRPGFSFDA